jgi:large subunit ribosomal protein L25
MVPGIVYGHKKEPVNIAVPAQDLETVIGHGAHVIELDVAGRKESVLIKDVQFDHLGDELVHVDFTRVDLTERVHVSVALEFKGTPVGTHEGGALDVNMVDVEVECVATEIPDMIRVNVAEMKLGDFMHVSDLELPEGMKAVSPAEAIVCSIRAKTAAAEVEAEEVEEEGEAQEPEIIGRKEKEEDEGAGEQA